MKVTYPLFRSMLMAALVLLCMASKGQSRQGNCDDIAVTVSSTNPEPGKKNGKIEFKFQDTEKKYKIFLINNGEQRARRDSGKVVENLQKGFYDFIIVDDKGCNKQITVTLK